MTSTVATAGTAALRVKLNAVGHGDSVILHWKPVLGNPSTILIDGGPKASATAIATALRDLHATKIDLAVLSHCDADHVDGLVEYASSADRLPIERFWGPCVRAFRRHDWLFPPRIARGLEMSDRLEELLKRETTISYPVEGAQWSSPDGDLVIRVLSPAGRLIERLLIGPDSDDLFLRSPTPLGWLLEPPAAVDPEDNFLDLRRMIASGEIAPDRIPVLPPARRTFDASETGDVAEKTGVDPQFFGNNVLNDTSIVLLIDVRIGAVRRRLLFTGDVENFTYLMAVHPMGLGCEVVKAPHHGSRSYVESSRPAYDEVWQWLRPKVTLVSANGKHRLPRLEFREAVLRYGATLFCTCRRSREILSGPCDQESCHEQFGCGLQSQGSVCLEITEQTMISDAVACGTAATSGVVPVIQMIQHTVEPSNILERFTGRELRLHATWAVKQLRSMHDTRCRAGGEAGLDAASMQTLAREATAVHRYDAAANIEVIIEHAAREGHAWISNPSRYSSEGRRAWVMPSLPEWGKLEAWIDNYEIIQLSINKRTVGLVPGELLLAADTGFLAARAARKFAFPETMFDEAIWPRLARHLVEHRTIATREFVQSGITAAVVLSQLDQGKTYRRLVGSLPLEPIHLLMQADKARGGQWRSASSELLTWPSELEDLVAPFWQKSERLIPTETRHALQCYGAYEEWDDPQGICSLVSKANCDAYRLACNSYSRSELKPETAREIFAASMLARLTIL